MTDLRKAAEMALNTLERCEFGVVSDGRLKGAIKTLRQALAQPEQERSTSKKVRLSEIKPNERFILCRTGQSYRMNLDGSFWNETENRPSRLHKNCEVQLYTAPPKREWVGLTDEEIYAIYGETELIVHNSWVGGGAVGLMFPISLYKAIEAKLKEKNT